MESAFRHANNPSFNRVKFEAVKKETGGIIAVISHYMARAAGVPFAAAGWCFDIPENERHMRENADFYFPTVGELQQHCFG